MMHVDEVAIDERLVRQLIRSRFPKWGNLPLCVVQSAGTDNAMFRLGDDMVVRLPRVASAAGQVETEQTWLPHLAPRLPLSIPRPIAMGDPGGNYPWRWSVYRWLEGETVSAGSLADMQDAALCLAKFIRALRHVDATGGPVPGPQNSGRGVPLAKRDEPTQEAIAQLTADYDVNALLQAWDNALDVPVWTAPPAWIHGDLQPGNLLSQNGRLTAVIDFGCMAIGDPACDLQPAWNFFSGESRRIFRDAVQVDDATWLRGCGWALSVALIALPYYRQTNPVLANIARFTIEQVLSDSGRVE